MLDALDTMYGQLTDTVRELGAAGLIWEWTEPAAAARRAARACQAAAVATQGHVLTPADFTAMLVVEAAVHYLDLTVH